MTNHRKRAAALVCGLTLSMLSAPLVDARTYDDGGTGPHRIQLSTREYGCTEFNVPRAGNLAAVRRLVPERYDLFVSPTGAARIRVVSYFCEAISVNGQKRAKPALVSLGVAETTSRDGDGQGDFYLLWYGSSDPVLVARMRQLGVQAQRLNEARVEPYVDGQPTWSLTVPAPLQQIYQADAVVAPLPAELEPPELGLRVFYDGPRGDLRLDYYNSAFSTGAANLRADLTGLEPLVPLITTPNLLILSGATRFGLYRGNWTLQAGRVGP